MCFYTANPKEKAEADNLIATIVNNNKKGLSPVVGTDPLTAAISVAKSTCLADELLH